ncbi:MAG: ABC transporter ATP-binding protein [Qingshengfaniella sp.]
MYRTRHGEHVALDNVSLEIGAGEFVVLLGPSGCGKSTLLRCIAGLEEPDGGEIVIDGKTVFSSAKGVFLPPEKRKLNMVFQSYALWPHFTVAENVAYPLRNVGLGRAEARRRAVETLETVGLAGREDAYPGQLSGGQQQRVALARTIVSDDGLVLLDEPLSNLDAKVRDRLRIELLALQERVGFSALYVTHDQVEALALADRIGVMDYGQFEQLGTPEDIYDRPKTRYVADFVGAANILDGTIMGLEGEYAQVSTALGTIRGVPATQRMAAGDTVSVVIRPEHCAVIPPGETPPPGADTMLAGRLERSLYLGAVTEYVLKIEAETLICSMSGGPKFDPGCARQVCFPAERARIFPKADK